MSMEAEVTVEKCRELWRQVAIEEREEEGYKDQAKQCRKRIENKVAEIRRLCMENHQQTEMELKPPTGWKCEACDQVFDEIPGETHGVETPEGTPYSCGPVVPYEKPAEEPAEQAPAEEMEEAVTS